MRKLIFIGSIVAGSAVGLLATLGDGWGLKLFMMCLGALVGAAAGGALSRIGRGRRPGSKSEYRNATEEAEYQLMLSIQNAMKGWKT